MQILRRLYTSIILFALGIFIAKTRILVGDGCKGFPDGLFFMFLSCIYLLTLTVIIIISAIKSAKKKVSFNYYPLFATVIVIAMVYVAFHSDKFESGTFLYATSSPSSNGQRQCSLTLRNNKTFKIKMQATEWSCYYKGNYNIQADTLTLMRPDITTRTDSVFAEKYLINTQKKTLFPITAFQQESTKQLTITSED